MRDHHALVRLREAAREAGLAERLWLVGGCVRDDLLGRPLKGDFDLVIEGDGPATALALAGASSIPPVLYTRFGTAMLRIEGANVELVGARRESYDPDSRKPDVEPATLEDDVRRRDFTVNALLRNLETWELRDPLGHGLADLEARVLRTPLDPEATFFDDPLRMLRAVRFRWQLGFDFAPGLEPAIIDQSARLDVISGERIRDEFVKMLLLPDADRALDDLLRLGLLAQFAPELAAMRGVEQGRYHDADVWDHTLRVVRNAGAGDLILTLACLLHDVGKPVTRMVDAEGQTRFFGHETRGAEIATGLLRRLRFANDTIEPLRLLVRNHMRLGSAPIFTAAAARRLVRDLGSELDRLLALVEADKSALRPGLVTLDLAGIRAQIEAVRSATPADVLVSPLTGDEIIAELGVTAGPEVGLAKRWLVDQVLEGVLAPGDRQTARRLLREKYRP
jgi:poly(A) polymerase